MSLIDKKLIVTASLTALLLQACASGQSSSFATRVNSDNSTQSFAGAEGGEDANSRFTAESDSRPLVLASSGNVLLPGAWSSALGGFTGDNLALRDPVGADPAGREVTAMLGGSLSLTRTDGAGPELSVGLGGGLAATGGGAGSPLLAAITPGTQGADALTGGLLSNTTGALGAATAPLTSGGAASAPLVTASAGGVSVAGQPLTSFGGSSSVLTNVGSAAGGAVSGAGSIVSGVNPGSATSGIVNAAAGEVAATVGTVTGPTGLGGLTGVLPGIRR